MKRVVALVVALVLGAGCSLGDTFADNGTVRADPPEDELVGVWTGYSSAARYELKADHTFVATAVPLVQLSSDPAARPENGGPFHGDGRWTYEPGPDNTRDPVLRYEHVYDQNDVPVPGTHFFLHTSTRTETVSPDHRLILSLTDDYLSKAG
ncbi:hypothetical protein [Dactylosporangium sp. CA-139066]|uniref:hypothetical protein n=1 Tax=Dactylosporangium sp. CA-139066 TaxID=3239930 RepID=UPI003D919305